MVLPLYLAITAQEMDATDDLPASMGWMACHFDPAGPGLRDLPEALPPETMLILNDRFPCRGHDPQLVLTQLAEAAKKLSCGGVLLDFEREPDACSRAIAEALAVSLPCPVGAPPGFSEKTAVFLPPCPLHIPLADHLRPWRGREIWLEVALQQQMVTVTGNGTQLDPAVPADRQGGTFDEILLCQCVTEISEEEVRFILFDTPETLKRKLKEAARLGASKAVGLYQELGGKL